MEFKGSDLYAAINKYVVGFELKLDNGDLKFWGQ